MRSALYLSKALQLIEFINFMNPIPVLSSGSENSYYSILELYMWHFSDFSSLQRKEEMIGSL